MYLFASALLNGSIFGMFTASPLLTALTVAISCVVAGAVSIALVRRTADAYVFDITATLDADTVSANIPHGMGVIPDVLGQQLIIQTVVSAALWSLTTIDVTNLVFTKAVGVGSGNAGGQYRVYVYRPK